MFETLLEVHMQNNALSPFSQEKKFHFYKHSNDSGIFQVLKSVPKKHLFSNLPYLTNDFGVQIFPNCVKIKCGLKSSFDRDIPERKKDDITKFSINARRRMIKFLSMVNLEFYEDPLFVTTTFHNAYPKNSEQLKTILRNYLKKLKYSFPDLHYAWRLEWQKRKAPHFHILLFPSKPRNNYERDKLVKQIKLAWFSFLKDHDYYTFKYSCDVQTIKEKKKLYSYVSKYTAKTEEESEIVYSGQRHGHSRDINIKPIESFSTSQEFVKLLKKKIWKNISKNLKNFEDFQKSFFDSGEISVLMDSKLIVKLCHETLRELTPT